MSLLGDQPAPDGVFALVEVVVGKVGISVVIQCVNGDRRIN